MPEALFPLFFSMSVSDVVRVGAVSLEGHSVQGPDRHPSCIVGMAVGVTGPCFSS